MAETQTFLDELAETLRIARFEPPLAEVGQYLRFGIRSDPGLLRAVDPALVASAVSGSIGGAIGGPVTATLAIPVERSVKLTVTWEAFRLVPVFNRGTGTTGPRVVETGRRTHGEGLIGRPPAAPEETELTIVSPGAMQEEQLEPEDGYLAPDGVNLPEVAFLFAPTFAPLSVTVLPAVDTIRVYATVKLTVGIAPGPQVHKEVRIGPITVLLPKLPVPRLLALFRYPQFNLETENGAPRKGQAALLVVPAKSPLGSFEQLQNALRTLRAALAPLRAIQRFARLLLGLQRLSGALSRRPRLRYALRDEIDDLHKVKLITVTRWQDPWVNDAAFPEINDFLERTPGLSGVSLDPPDIPIGDMTIRTPDIGATPGNNADNDIYAGNRMSSLIFIGPPGAKAECFVDKNFKKGRLIVTTGPEAVVTISSLAYPDDAEAPATVPEDRAVADPQPSPRDGGFDDRISSLKL